jgi:ABC-type oligopeptide transport system substrate-binding subunit
MAVDPKAWNQAANNGEGLPTSSVITPNAPCFDPGTSKLAPTPSIDHARAVLRSAGYAQDASGKFSKGGKPLALKLLTNNTQGSGPEYLLNQFTQLGATVTLDNPDYSQFATRFRAGDWDVTVGQWSLPTPGPSQIFASFAGPVPPTGSNFTRIQDPDLARAIAVAEATTGPEQCRDWATVQRSVLEKSHVLPLPGQVTTVFARTGFSFVPNSSIFIEPYDLRAPATT